jgi:hypothetical protein
MAEASVGAGAALEAWIADDERKIATIVRAIEEGCHRVYIGSCHAPLPHAPVRADRNITVSSSPHDGNT